MNDLRRDFVLKVLQRSASFAALCREFGVSRKTGYKWKQRALEEGVSGLGEHSRRPKRNPRQLAEAVVCGLIRLRLRHPQWGPVKLCEIYRRSYGVAPSVSSCHRVLQQAGLVLPRRCRVRVAAGRLQARLEARAPNEVWTADFKGWWRLGNKERCEPLTVRDAFSRFVLALRVPGGTDTAAVRAEFVRLFETYGLPKVIRTDNGAPFACSRAVLGLSRLSAWWVSLGILLDRSRPAHPEDNGAHERLHRDIATEVAGHVQVDRAAQQAACDVWREEFNWLRPHAALAGRCPGEIYGKSPRHYTEATLEYGPGFHPRRVSANGLIAWERQRFFISGALAGCDLGLRCSGPHELEVWLHYLFLGTLELQTNSFRSAPSRAAEAARLSA
jgi:transposase InsO family protein